MAGKEIYLLSLFTWRLEYFLGAQESLPILKFTWWSCCQRKLFLVASCQGNQILLALYSWWILLGTGFQPLRQFQFWQRGLIPISVVGANACLAQLRRTLSQCDGRQWNGGDDGVPDPGLPSLTGRHPTQSGSHVLAGPQPRAGALITQRVLDFCAFDSIVLLRSSEEEYNQLIFCT